MLRKSIRTKSAGIVSASILILLTAFTSCENFAAGSLLKDEIQKEIAYAKAQEVNIMIAPSDSAHGTTYPNITKTYKVTDTFSVRFKEAESYYFVRWVAKDVASDQIVTDIVEFENPEELETTVTVVGNGKDIHICPVVIARPGVKEFYPKNSEKGEPRDSSIVITFNKSLAAENDFSKIQIFCGGEEVSNSFLAPVLNENILTIAADKSNLIEVDSNKTKTVSVTLPSDIYFEDDGTKVLMNESGTFSYKINSTTNTKAEITVSTTADKGTVTPSGTKSYNIGETFNLLFEPSDDYNFTGWNILDGEGEAVSDSVLKIEDINSVSTKVTVLAEVSGVSITPESTLMPMVITADPKYSSSGSNFDSVITVQFNKTIETQKNSESVFVIAKSFEDESTASIIIKDKNNNYLNYLYTKCSFDNVTNILTIYPDYENYLDPNTGKNLDYFGKMDKAFGSATHLDLYVTVQNLCDTEEKPLFIEPYQFNFRLNKTVKKVPPVVEAVRIGKTLDSVNGKDSINAMLTTSPYGADGKLFYWGQEEGFDMAGEPAMIDAYVPYWKKEQWRTNLVSNKVYLYVEGYDAGGSGLKNAFVKETLIIKTDGTTVSKSKAKHTETSLLHVTNSENQYIAFEYELQSEEDGVIQLELGFDDWSNNHSEKKLYVLKDTTAPECNSEKPKVSNYKPDATYIYENETHDSIDLISNDDNYTMVWPGKWTEDELSNSVLKFEISSYFQDLMLRLDEDGNQFTFIDYQPEAKLYYTQDKSLLNQDTIPSLNISNILDETVILPKKDSAGKVLIDPEKNTFIRICVSDFSCNKVNYYYDVPAAPKILQASTYVESHDFIPDYYELKLKLKAKLNTTELESYTRAYYLIYLKEKYTTSSGNYYYRCIATSEVSGEVTTFNDEWLALTQDYNENLSMPYGDPKIFIQTVLCYGDLGDSDPRVFGPLTEVPFTVKNNTTGEDFAAPVIKSVLVTPDEEDTHTFTVTLENNGVDYDSLYAEYNKATYDSHKTGDFFENGSLVKTFSIDTSLLHGWNHLYPQTGAVKDFELKIIGIKDNVQKETTFTINSDYKNNPKILPASNIKDNIKPKLSTMIVDEAIRYDMYGKYLEVGFVDENLGPRAVKNPVDIYVAERQLSESDILNETSYIHHYQFNNPTDYGVMNVPIADLPDGEYYFYMRTEDYSGNKNFGSLIIDSDKNPRSLTIGFSSNIFADKKVVAHSHASGLTSGDVTNNYNYENDCVNNIMIHLEDDLSSGIASEDENHNIYVYNRYITMEYYDESNQKWIVAKDASGDLEEWNGIANEVILGRQFKYYNDLHRDSGVIYYNNSLHADVKNKFVRYFITEEASYRTNTTQPHYFYSGTHESVEKDSEGCDVRECTIKDFISGSNGVQIYCNDKAMIHTFVSDKNWGDDADAWLYHTYMDQEQDIKIINGKNTYENVPYYYVVNKSNINKGQYYVVIATFADGTNLMSKVYKK